MLKDALLELSKFDSSEDPFDQNFNRMLDAFISGNHPYFCPAERAWNPPTDVFETGDALHVRIELAGVQEKDIYVKVNDNFLVIRGKRSDEQHVVKENFHLMEIQYGSFERVFKLPENMEVKEIKATLKNGFLLVTIPKDNKSKQFSIEVQ